MTNNTLRPVAKSILTIFNPLIIPTLCLLILILYTPGLQLFSFKAKSILFIIVLLSTCLLPLFFVFLVSLSHGFSKDVPSPREKVLPYIFTALSTLLGAQFLSKLPFPSVFKLLLFGCCAILVLLFLISVWWKISVHTAAIGGLIGTLLALNIKYGIDLLYPLLSFIVLAGIIASSAIYLEKHTPAQTYIGFILSGAIMYFTVYFY